MNYLRQIFGKGSFWIYATYGITIQVQRRFILPYTNLGKQLSKNAKSQLSFNDPENDYSKIDVFSLNSQQQKLLKKITKKKIEAIQQMNDPQNQTWMYTAGIISFGGISYLFNPLTSVIFVGSYLSLLTLDYARCIAFLKFDVDLQEWKVNVKEIGYLANVFLGAVAVIGLGRAAGRKIVQKGKTAIVKSVKENNQVNK